MYEGARGVGDRPAEAGFCGLRAQRLLKFWRGRYVDGEAAHMQAAFHAADGFVVRRAAVAACYYYRARKAVAQLLKRDDEPPVHDDRVTAGALEFAQIKTLSPLILRRYKSGKIGFKLLIGCRKW